MVYFGCSDSTVFCLEQKMNRFSYLCILLSFFAILSCNTNKDEVPQTATSGKLKVAVDEGFWPIMKAEKDIFEYIYKYATVQQTRTTQDSAIKLLVKDSVRFVVTARKLNDGELDYLKSRKVYPKTYMFAQDGLLLLSSKKSTDSTFTFPQLREIAEGKTKGYQLVVDKNQSASLYSFVELLRLKNSKLAAVYSSDSVEALIQYVTEHSNAIGIVGSSWFSEMESKKVQKWLEGVTVCSISSDGKAFYQPFQSEIADSLYPLSRPIYLISRESQMSLANGYAAFLLGEKGQRIVLKSGLLPAKIPSRQVVVSKKPL